MHEVIVVGAGPAGSVAATVLAQAGRDVLLLDRTRFPRDKACGDMIPWGAVQLMFDLGMGEAVRAADFYPIKAARIVSPSGVVFETSLADHGGPDTCIVPREVFDTLLWEHAGKNGAHFEIVQVEEPILQDGRVVGVRGRTPESRYAGGESARGGALREIRAQLVIAADGATSVIARALRGTRSPDLHRAVALRAYVDDLDLTDHMSESYFTRDLIPGYGWVFPAGERCANVGVGLRLDLFRRKGRTLKEMLDDFLHLPMIAARRGRDSRVEKVLVWQLNFGSDVFPRAYDGALLIGDAGGFTDPLTGGGIYGAMVTGKLAGEVALQALAEGDPRRQALAPFEAGWRQQLWPSFRLGYWLQRWLISSPRLVDLIVAFMVRHPGLVQYLANKL